MKTNKQEKFVSENVGQIRFAINTKRSEIIEKLSSSEGTPEELGLNELARISRFKRRKRENRSANTLAEKNYSFDNAFNFRIVGNGSGVAI